MKSRITTLVAALIALPAIAAAQAHFDSGSDGSDGELIIANSETVVLNMDDNPDGVWNYTSVTMGSGSRLFVEANADNTPLVMLVQGDFIMSGDARINLAGTNGNNGAGAIAGQGGAGGFQGGLPGEVSPVPRDPGPGMGPGGGESIDAGDVDGVGGGLNTHMRPSLIPLIGGSGGGGGFAVDAGAGGGGGGGAILIAVNGLFDMATTSFTGIDVSGGNAGSHLFGSNGGGGGGAGGACRIIAGEIRGGFIIDASGGTGGLGQSGVDGGGGEQGVIRLETFRLTRTFGTLAGRVYNSLPGLVNADATDIGSLRISSVGGVAVPANAGSNIALPDVVIPSGVSNPIRIIVEATNVTTGQAATIRLNYNDNGGQIIEMDTGPLTGTNALSTAFADINMPAGVGTMAAILRTAVSPGAVASVRNADTAAERALANMKITIDGEPITEIETVATAGLNGREVVYRTESGKTAAYAAP